MEEDYDFVMAIADAMVLMLACFRQLFSAAPLPVAVRSLFVPRPQAPLLAVKFRVRVWVGL